MTGIKRTWINTIVGLAAVGLVLWLSPTPHHQPHGILLPAKEIRPSISPDTVVQLQNRPFSGKIMGYINIERHYPAPDKVAQRQIGKLAQLLASQVGANGIFVTNFRLGAVTRSRFIYVFQAIAYYTPMTQGLLESSIYDH